MTKVPRSLGDHLFSIILLIIGLIIIVGSLQLGFGRFAKPGPGIFPFFCGLIVCIQSIMLHLFKAISLPARSTINDRSQIQKFILVVMTFVLWVVLMPFLGWILLTSLLTISISKIMDMKGWINPLLLSIANTLLLYLLFGYFLSIDLPNGIWGS